MRFAVIAATALLLAGCTDLPDDQTTIIIPFDAEPVAYEAGVEHPAQVKVQVIQEQEGGKKLRDVAVALYTRDEENPSGLRVLTVGRTDIEGTVNAYVAPHQDVYVLAGDHPRFTNEGLGPVPVGQPNSTVQLSVPLFLAHKRVDVDMEGGLGASGGLLLGPGSTSTVYAPIRFHEDDAINAAYLERLSYLDSSIGWSNSPTGAADLYAGLGIADTVVKRGSDETQDPRAGRFTEHVNATKAELDLLRANLTANGLQAVMLSDSYRAGPLGLDVRFSTLAEFSRLDVRFLYS
ncbi:MAG: hypothetical protein ACPGQL_09240 [Thermoplasmatota archaeon]